MRDINGRISREYPIKRGYVRVIRDQKNINLDYYIPRVRAIELYNEGKLIQIEVYSNGWAYSTRETHEYYD
jgi:hypothetical protein